MKSLFVAFIAGLACLGAAQQAPVTRAEFANFFMQIAASLDVPEAQRKGLLAFPLDGNPVVKAEVAEAMMAAAKVLGKNIGSGADPMVRLRNANILSADAAIFTDPGKQFRPADLIKALVAFVDGITGKPGSRALTRRR